jgi:hypothetical protein
MLVAHTAPQPQKLHPAHRMLLRKLSRATRILKRAPARQKGEPCAGLCEEASSWLDFFWFFFHPRKKEQEEPATNTPKINNRCFILFYFSSSTNIPKIPPT